MGFRRRICTFYIVHAFSCTESAGLTIQVKHCGVPLFHKNRSCISRGQRFWSSHLQAERLVNLEERQNDWDRVLLESKSISREFLDFFSCRQITRATLERNQVTPYLSESGQAAIRFPYLLGGKIVNYKYRGIACKTFWQEKGADKIFYGIDDIVGAKTIIIVEGEIDKLSMEEAGIRNCVSVPNGAPAKLSPKPSLEDGRMKDKDTKFEYLWNCHKYFKEAEQIILATDGDEPGLALAEELARRLGRERCWRVKWPSMNGKQCKDANEVLTGLGRDALVDTIEKAEHYPICGLFHFSSFYKEIEDFFDEGDQKQWFSTGWKQLDQIYKVVPGELTLVTGVPNSGKSEWIDALLCNLNKLNGWTFALCSMENRVKDHARKLLEKHFKKPFFDADYALHKQRMSRAELEQGMEWLNKTFYLIRDENDELQSIEWILDLAKAAVLRHGIRGLVIDPYNEIDHQRSDKQSETEYVSALLTKIKRFAQLHDCHVWFVAHPRQMYNWNGEPPSLYDISGSAHFINKSDNGIVIHRSFDYTGAVSANVQVIVRKVRNKIAGRIGKADLKYDRETGTYT